MVQTRDIEYTVDGTAMLGRLHLPDGAGPRPGVLVAHEANGRDVHPLERAHRLAELGYVAFALDYHGGARVYTDLDEMMTRLAAVASDPARLRGISRAGLDVLLGEPRVDATRVAAIGFCFGAVMMLDLARAGADLRAVVGFHPGSVDHDPGEARNITGKVLVCVGSEEPVLPGRCPGRLRGRDARRRRRLATARVRRGPAQLHQPGRFRRRAACAGV